VPEGFLHRADWDLPAGVHAFFTSRHGGTSRGPYTAFNLGLHVGDVEADVLVNRQMLIQALAGATGSDDVRIQWLQQVHGKDVYSACAEPDKAPPCADAFYTTEYGIAGCVMTADCLPVMLCAADGREIAVAHAGWRGLQAGVIENTLARFAAEPARISAWLGPAIGPCHFEVGPEVRQAYLSVAAGHSQAATTDCFQAAINPDKWMADLYGLARIRLQEAGVLHIAGSLNCTVCHADTFYSHRHSQPTGRFATLILKTRPA
jgi:YfiH family protein